MESRLARFAPIFAIVLLLTGPSGCSGGGGAAPDRDGGVTLDGAPAQDGGDALDGAMPPDAGMHAEPCAATDPRPEAPAVFIGPDGLAARFVSLFGMATSHLDVAVYEIDDPQILDALGAAASRGVAVRVLLDGNASGNDASQATLEAAGVAVHHASSTFSYYHPKLMLVDDAIGVVTSANLNQYSTGTERNHGVVLHDPDDLRDLAALFEADWSGAPTPADLTCTRLVLSPDNSRARIEALIASATTDLRLQELELSDTHVRSVIADRVAAGVHVRILLADPAWITSNTAAADALRMAGADVRFFTRLDNHAKLIVADDAAAFVGSENLSYTSLQRNREVGVVLTSTAPVATLAASFDGDWDASAP